MGRTALFVVMGLGAAFGVIGINLNRSAEQSTRVMSSYMQYTQARNLARSAVHARLRDIDRDTVIQTGYKSTAFYGGTYATTVSMPSLDTLLMIAVGTFQDTTYTMKLTLKRYPKPFPSVAGAVGLVVNPVQFQANGNPHIYGNDHDTNGNDISGTGNDKPGVGVLTTADSSTVAPYAGNIDGNPKIQVVADMENPRDYIPEYLANADYKYVQNDSPINGQTWGSVDNPVIVTCRSNLGQSIKINGNAEGWGLLVVEGGLELAGTFKWHGLVIATGDTSVIDVSASTGTPEIIGGLIMAGAPNSKFTMKGNANFKYSSQALEISKYIKKLMAYKIVSWYE